MKATWSFEELGFIPRRSALEYLGLIGGGAYIVEVVVQPGTYKLKWPNGSTVPRT